LEAKLREMEEEMIGLMGRSQGSSALSSNEKKKITDSG
jgi:hypothetical protein